jgi:hypothetical protein
MIKLKSQDDIDTIITIARGYKILELIEELESFPGTLAFWENGYINFTSIRPAESFIYYIENHGGFDFKAVTKHSGQFKI